MNMLHHAAMEVVLSLGTFACTLLVTSHTTSVISGLFVSHGNSYLSNSAGLQPHTSYSNSSDMNSYGDPLFPVSNLGQRMPVKRQSNVSSM